MTGYTKLFQDIVTSTIWGEDDQTRIVWVTMLALKDSKHFVSASVPGLARQANVSLEDCQRALAKLEAPDPHSRSQEFEGRRIQKADGGWLILNGQKYRERMNLDERREYQRTKQAEYRARKRERERVQAENDERAKRYVKAAGDGAGEAEVGAIAAEGLPPQG